MSDSSSSSGESTSSSGEGVVPSGGYHTSPDTISGAKYGPKKIPKGMIVFFGDSDIEYWRDSGWSNDFEDVAVNVGIGGATIEEAAAHVKSLMKALTPNGFVVLCSGENDMDADSDVDVLFELWKFTATTILESKHNPRLIFISTKPEPDSQELLPNYEKYDALIKNYAKALADDSSGLPPIVFVDLYTCFNDMGNPRDLYRDDGLHMTDKGYAILTPKVKEVMDGFGGWLI